MMLNSITKIFLIYPTQLENQILKLMDIASKCESPDVRDRAYIYWRILSINPEKLKKFLFA